MKPTSFQFTMTVPCDTRLVGAVRDVAAHAAAYAELTSSVATQLAEQVAAAASTTMDLPHPAREPVELRFARDPEGLQVRITRHAGPSGTVPDCPRSPDLVVEWAHDGSRWVCLIAHRAGS